MAALDEHCRHYYGIMFTSTQDGERLNALDAIVKDASKKKLHWMEAFDQMKGGWSASSASSAELASLRAERDRLARENASLRQTLARAQERAREVELLRKQHEELTRIMHGPRKMDEKPIYSMH
jgi:hypothetical protein